MRTKYLPLTGLLFFAILLYQCKREEFKWGKKIGDLTYLENTVILGQTELSCLTDFSGNKMTFSNLTGELGSLNERSF
jgi:hypothetical protein